MKIIDGIKHYTSTEVAKLINRSPQTLINWDKYSRELEVQGEERLIPAPVLIGKGNHRYWNKEQIERIIDFRDNIRPGDMAIYNRKLWG